VTTPARHGARPVGPRPSLRRWPGLPVAPCGPSIPVFSPAAHSSLGPTGHYDDDHRRRPGGCPLVATTGLIRFRLLRRRWRRFCSAAPPRHVLGSRRRPTRRSGCLGAGGDATVTSKLLDDLLHCRCPSGKRSRPLAGTVLVSWDELTALEAPLSISGRFHQSRLTLQ